MRRQELEASLAEGGPHHRLLRMVGRWEGETRVWFEPDAPPAIEMAQRGSIRAILGDRFVLHEYDAGEGDRASSGVAIYGMHLDAQAHESAWVDSFHTGTSVMHSVGPLTGGAFSVRGSYADGSGGPPWGWKTVIEQRTDEELVIAMFNIPPGGSEHRALETRYRRVDGGG